MKRMDLSSFLQPAGPPITARLGLISDTHMPERCAALPASLFEVLQGVDLLLHAGDVGELWVLDRLSAIAPVVAVHGNDDTRDAQRELPYQQLVSVAGQRILLWHSHYVDPVEDRANRAGPWPWIWDRQARRAHQAAAGIVVFGHTHVPMRHQYQGVLLVNPGALASGSLFTRQAHQTVAILAIHDDGTSSVAHVDLVGRGQVYTPSHDWQAGFQAAQVGFEVPIVEPGLLEDVGRLRAQAFDDWPALKEAILPLCHRCWAGQRPPITREELLRQVKGSPRIAPADRQRALAILQSPISNT